MWAQYAACIWVKSLMTVFAVYLRNVLLTRLNSALSWRSSQLHVKRRRYTTVALRKGRALTCCAPHPSSSVQPSCAFTTRSVNIDAAVFLTRESLGSDNTSPAVRLNCFWCSASWMIHEDGDVRAAATLCPICLWGQVWNHRPLLNLLVIVSWLWLKNWTISLKVAHMDLY